VILAPFGTSVSADDVRRIDATIVHGGCVAVASRRLPESRWLLPPGSKTRFLTAAVNDAWLCWCSRTVLGLPFGDLFSGLVGLRLETARRLAPMVRNHGWLWQAELLTACHRLGIPVNETPVVCAFPFPRPNPGLENTARFMRSLRAIRREWPVAPPQRAASWDDDWRTKAA
jgi:hypothetical protein